MENLPPPPGETDSHAPASSLTPDCRKRFSWSGFGGDGLLVSVAFHLILAIVAVFYISREVMKAKPSADRGDFVPPGGSGNGGEKLLRERSASKSTPTSPMKASPRVATRNPSAVSLPDNPRADMPSFAANLKSGELAKDFGGPGTGGLNGKGMGPGGAKGLNGMFG